MVRRRGGNNLQKMLKDYMVPIIGFLLILVLIFSVFSGGDDTSTQDTIENENSIGIGINLNGELAESYIVYPGDYKNKIDSNAKLYKGEKIIVKEGSADLDFVTVGDMSLDKNGELKYEEDGSISLFSSNLWVNTDSNLDLAMRFANVKLSSNSTVSLSQNEVSSSIYLLSGFVEVLNLSGRSTVLAPGQKITISRQEASQEDLDLSLNREEIDDYFKSTTWYIQNDGDSYMSSNSDIESSSTGELITFKDDIDSILEFDNLSDESLVSSPGIDITGKYLRSDISKIELNGIEAVLDTDDQTFSFEGVEVSSRTNDLVFRIYDNSNDLLSKFLYTVYYNSGSSNTSANQGFSVTNYSADANDFRFTSPSTTGTFTTYDFGLITIRGTVSDENVSSVSVNGYTLKSFNGTTWRYHASPDNNNLKEGTNVYEVKYYSSDGKIIYSNNFIIVKKSSSPQNNNSSTEDNSQAIDSDNTYSSETQA